MVDLEKMDAAHEIVADALAEIELRYGPESDSPLEYHNTLHTLDMLESLEKLTALAVAGEQINEAVVPVFLVAGAKHDLIQYNGFGANERASAESAQEAMYESGIFSAEDIRLAGKLIISSTAEVRDGQIVHPYMEPCPEAGLFVDGDLCHLGKPPSIYWDRSRRLYDELFKDQEPECLRTFIRLQPRILANHQFRSAEAQMLYPHTQRNIAFVQKLLANIPYIL